ncbi:WbqC family protein [Methanosarcina sp. Mfa9]|uniref:WbqC family protein n=1 Tax=Methanosarcina sp. Mfa9 TaxID=3439063 RepID=UPI003F83933A
MKGRAMIVSIHQPNYLPYLGFFDKMKKSDVFVIYDDAQFNKGDFHHRNKIRIYHGWKWLTVPVEKKRIPINEIKIKKELNDWKGVNWSESHLTNIIDNYKDAPYFATYEDELEKIYNITYKKVFDINMSLILFLKKAFDIDVKIVFSSDLVNSENVSPDSRSSEKLFEIVQALNGEIYLSGPTGRDYLNEDIFTKNGIEVNFQKFDHPVYAQNYEGFVPNLAAVDALFNLGEMPK